MTKEVALIQTSQALLQFGDMGKITKDALEILLDNILPVLEPHNREQVLCQCLDRQLDIEVDDTWGFNYEETREKFMRESKNEG